MGQAFGGRPFCWFEEKIRVTNQPVFLATFEFWKWMFSIISYLFVFFQNAQYLHLINRCTRPYLSCAQHIDLIVPTSNAFSNKQGVGIRMRRSVSVCSYKYGVGTPGRRRLCNSAWSRNIFINLSDPLSEFQLGKLRKSYTRGGVWINIYLNYLCRHLQIWDQTQS